MAAQQRIAELERQLAELSGDFEATRFALEVAFDAGYACSRGGIADPRAAARTPRPRHLRAVQGGQ
jgi:hypothetical protein